LVSFRGEVSGINQSPPRFQQESGSQAKPAPPSSFFAALSDPIGGDRRSDANAKRLIGWNPCSDESDVSGIGGRNEIHDFCQGESEH
jgi:hypothetical protein